MKISKCNQFVKLERGSYKGRCKVGIHFLFVVVKDLYPEGGVFGMLSGNYGGFWEECQFGAN